MAKNKFGKQKFDLPWFDGWMVILVVLAFFTLPLWYL